MSTFRCGTEDRRRTSTLVSSSYCPQQSRLAPSPPSLSSAAAAAVTAVAALRLPGRRCRFSYGRGYLSLSSSLFSPRHRIGSSGCPCRNSRASFIPLAAASTSSFDDLRAKGRPRRGRHKASFMGNTLVQNVYEEQFWLFSLQRCPSGSQPTGAMIRHAYLAKTPVLCSDISIANRIVDSYFNCGALDEAADLLVELNHPNSVLWNLVISSYNKNFLFNDSVRTFQRMHYSGVELTEFTYGSILSACSSSQDLHLAKQIHSLVLKNGYLRYDYVFTGLVDLFSKIGFFVIALKLFMDIPVVENIVCWNAIIAGGVANGEDWVAIDLFYKMIHGCFMPNAFTFSSVLTACTVIGELDLGMVIHGWVVKCGVEHDIFVGTGIIDLYSKCSNAFEALKNFLSMSVHNVVSWTAIISAFVDEDHIIALQLFNQMRDMVININSYTVTSVLAACARPKMIREALQIHCCILKMGFYMHPSVRDALINTYGKTGNAQISEKVFEDIGVADIDAWVAIISVLAQCNNTVQCIEIFCALFSKGLRPNEFCVTSILSVVTSLDLGKQIHSYLLKSALLPVVRVSCALFTMYSRCCNLTDSYHIFKQMPERDRISWTSMIAGFAEHGCAEEAFRLFNDMMVEGIAPDQMDISAILHACSLRELLTQGKEIHCYVLRGGFWHDMDVSSALINMYSKCKALDYAINIYERMLEKDQFSQSLMVSGYAKNCRSKEALVEFKKIIANGFEVDHVTVLSALGASADLASPECGKQLHGYTIKIGLSNWPELSSILITTYAKCGLISDSRKQFDQSKEHDRVIWTSMIDGYAQHGNGKEALKLYELMINRQIEPDSVTFTAVLSACSHNGLVDEGLFHFNSMSQKYYIEPEEFHYACVIDLLCRSGRLEEAAGFIDKMPVKPNSLIWTTLLSACRSHGELELGRKAAEKVLELEPNDSGAFISLSNICAETEDWKKVLEIRNLMSRVAAKKEPGWSSM